MENISFSAYFPKKKIGMEFIDEREIWNEKINLNSK